MLIIYTLKQLKKITRTSHVFDRVGGGGGGGEGGGGEDQIC